jgi:hypothetical protein
MPPDLHYFEVSMPILLKESGQVCVFNLPGNNVDIGTPRGKFINRGSIDTVEALIAADGVVSVLKFQGLIDEISDGLAIGLAGHALDDICEQGKTAVGVDGFFKRGNGGRTRGEEVIEKVLRCEFRDPVNILREYTWETASALIYHSLRICFWYDGKEHTLRSSNTSLVGAKRANSDLVKVDLGERIDRGSPLQLGQVVRHRLVEDVHTGLCEEGVDGEELRHAASAEDGPVVELAGGQCLLLALTDEGVAVDGLVCRGGVDVDSKDEVGGVE